MPTEIEKLAETYPRYLTPRQQKDLTEELDRFPAITYYSKPQDILLQGDVWLNVSGYIYKSGGPEFTPYTWMIISNTCDVAAENRRFVPPSVVFAPVVATSRYLALMKQSGATDEQIQSYMGDIRSQRLTGLFFLPAGGGLDEDSIVLFDGAQSKPLSMFTREEGKVKSLQLSQSAFWVLLIKLSIHFCRAFENVER